MDQRKLCLAMGTEYYFTDIKLRGSWGDHSLDSLRAKVQFQGSQARLFAV